MHLHFKSDQRENQVSPGLHAQQVGGQYANVSRWRQHEKAWDLFKKRLVSMIQITLSFERQ